KTRGWPVSHADEFLRIERIRFVDFLVSSEKHGDRRQPQAAASSFRSATFVSAALHYRCISAGIRSQSTDRRSPRWNNWTSWRRDTCLDRSRHAELEANHSQDAAALHDAA